MEEGQVLVAGRVRASMSWRMRVVTAHRYRRLHRHLLLLALSGLSTAGSTGFGLLGTSTSSSTSTLSSSLWNFLFFLLFLLVLLINLVFIFVFVFILGILLIIDLVTKGFAGEVVDGTWDDLEMKIVSLIL